MKIVFYCNLVYGGFSPRQYETGIGGSEEKLIELARELAKKHDITIYMNGEHGIFDKVKYEPHKSFKPWEKIDVFISFKNREILTQSINADKIFHWTTEVEYKWQNWQLNGVDKILPISEYHASRFNPQNSKLEPLYLWADLDRMEKNKVEKEDGSMLYSSSYDRGLEELLVRWPILKEKLNLKRLYITYGWEFLDLIIKHDPGRQLWKRELTKLMKQDGIDLVGRLSYDEMCQMYWRSKYWCLPLNNPDSELFCINAIKAQAAGCIPVVRRIGALQETVNQFIDWDSLFGAKASQSTFDKKSLEANRRHAKQFNLKKGIKQWKKIIEG